MGRAQYIIIEVPFTPPSVNHYKEPIKIRRRDGTTVTSFALTAEAKAFRDTIAVFARGETLVPRERKEWKNVRYAITATVFLGKRQRGDGDNFWKCIADSLVNARVIHSDARVRRWQIEIEDGYRDSPRTLICVSLCGRTKTLAERLKARHPKGTVKNGPSNLFRVCQPLRSVRNNDSH